MIQVIKRDGEVSKFNLSKISSAITKAFEATKTKIYKRILLIYYH